MIIEIIKDPFFIVIVVVFLFLFLCCSLAGAKEDDPVIGVKKGELES